MEIEIESTTTTTTTTSTSGTSVPGNTDSANVLLLRAHPDGTATEEDGSSQPSQELVIPVRSDCVKLSPVLRAASEFAQLQHEGSALKDPLDVPCNAEELQSLGLYLNTGAWDGRVTPQLASILCLTSTAHESLDEFPESFVKIYMTERWQRSMTVDSPVVCKHDFFDVMDQIPVWSDQSILAQGHVVAVSSRRDLSINPGLLSVKQQKEELLHKGMFEEVRLSFGGLDLKKYGGKLVMAGGGVFSSIFGQVVRDWDLFFAGCTVEEAEAIMDDLLGQWFPAAQPLPDLAQGFVIRRIYRHWGTGNRKFVATPNAWSIGKYQFIFRLYKNLDEILLGFDVDSCCCAYDGTTLWVSDRALHAFKHHCNVVCLDRLSASYEYRLVKYLDRGFDICVPGFDPQFLLPPLQNLPAEGNFIARFNPVTGRLSLAPRRRISSRFRRLLNGIAARVAATVKQEAVNYDISLCGMDALLFLTRMSSVTRNCGGLAVSDYGMPVTEPIGGKETEDPSLKTREGSGPSNSSDDHSEVAAEDEIVAVPHRIGSRRRRSAIYSRVGGTGYLHAANMRPPSPNGWTKIQRTINNTTEHLICKMGKIVTCNVPYGNRTVAELTVIARAANVMPQWKTQDPGQQITSSFHAIALVNPTQWYEGKLYDYKRQRNLPVSEEEKQRQLEEAAKKKQNENKKITITVQL